MAENHGTLLDEDGEPSDWIELYNPTKERINLLGWSLSDDANLPAKWPFPDRSLEPGAFLVVFASGKNRVGSGQLHTNFRLEAGGEYLGLFAPAETKAASEFNFPKQEADISFGLSMGASTRDLLSAAPVWLLQPSAAGDLPQDWVAPGEITGSDWVRVPGFGIGYDDAPATAGQNLALKGVANQSTTGFGLPAVNAVDGDPSTFTHTASDDNASTWWIDLGVTTEIQKVILRNRQDCCGTRLRDITVNLLAADGQTVAWSSGLLNPENALGSPASLVVDLFELNVGPIEARVVQVVRTPDPDLSGSNGAGNADEDNVLSLGEVEVYGADSVSLGPFLRTDLGKTMKGRNASAFVRVPFVLDTLDEVTALTLSLRYEDGVVVYLNGQEIIARNAPAERTWNATASLARNKSDALQPELIDLLPLKNLWRSGTNWLAFQGLNASKDDAEFLLDAQLLVAAPGPQSGAFLERPTPGESNSSGWNLGRLPKPQFTMAGGFVQGPFELALSNETAGAEIRYTLNGSAPTLSDGLVYAGPIRIDHSTVVRAAAFKANYRASDVGTHTYLFLANAINQPAAPAGFPGTWANVPGDYAMDARITQAPAYAGQMEQSLKALPSLALNTALDNLFGPSGGIYANPEHNGADWERPISLEWIRPDGSRWFQVDCGLRIQGGYFRQRNVTQKHSLRLLFKGAYGPGQLHQNLFDEFGAAQEFDTLVLRAGANDGYAWDDARDTEQFLRDEFGRRTLLEMGEPSPRGQFVHVYLNGLYWGLYNLTERPAEDFSATYLGGDSSEWDAVNSGDVKSGSLDAWNAFLSGVRGVKTLAEYQRLKGLNADGTRNSAFPEYFDATNYIDYMLVNIWGGNWDWPNKNFWFGRHRGDRAGGFKFYLWDFENTMGNNRARSPLNMVAPRAGVTDSWVGEPHARLKSFSEYQLEFADRVQKHCFHNGALTPEALIPRYRRLADLVEPAVLAETARWGDDHWSPPQDLTDWQRERDWLLGTYLPQRTGIVLAQLQAAGLYPNTAAPQIEPFGGMVSSATPIKLSASANELFYTTNGLDPRLPGGAVRPEAVRMDPSSNSIFLSAATVVKARARQGTAWSALSEAAFALDLVPATSNQLVIAEFCYRPAEPGTPAERAVTNDRDSFEFIEVLNVSTQAVDLTGVRFTAGVLFDFATGSSLQANESAVIVQNETAFRARYGPTARVLGQFQGNLSNSGEELAVVNAVGQDIVRFHYLDRAPWPEIPNQDGSSLVLRRPRDRPDQALPGQWRSSLQPGGAPGAADAVAFSGVPTADRDGNGQMDVFDYAFGLLLTDSKTGLAVSLERGNAAGATQPTLVLSIPCNLAADDVRIILEEAQSPAGPWQPANVALVREERTNQTGMARQSFRLISGLDGNSLFLRLSFALMR